MTSAVPLPSPLCGLGVGSMRCPWTIPLPAVGCCWAGSGRKATTSPPTPGPQIDPSRLRHLASTRPTQVGAMASTYGPMARGFVSRVGGRDGFRRKVLAWRLAMTLETEPCVEALRDARARQGTPAIMNTAGSPVTAVALLTALPEAQIAISMDGKGAWRDTVFVSLSNGFGGRLSTRPSPSGPMAVSRRHGAVCTAI